jgi:hypothetical protein
MADDEAKPKRKATDNPWYRLATFHGEPSQLNDEIAVKNRKTWNRCVASRILSENQRAALLKHFNAAILKGWSSEELTPFSEDERLSIEAQVGSTLEVDGIDFSSTEFETPFYAVGMILPRVEFRDATFRGEAIFWGTTFAGRAGFGGATFGGFAFFGFASFGNHAFFGSATFIDRVDFQCASFGRSVGFANATFSGGAIFDKVTFREEARFSGAVMNGETRFDGAGFSEPPQCFDTKLSEGTTWHDVRWPEAPHDIFHARRFIVAYERLKLEMDKLKKHGDELDFFALEQQCRRVVRGFWKGLPIGIYGFLSDYGRSYLRPLLLLVQTVLIGAVPLLVVPERVDNSDFFRWNSAAEAIGISFANTFSILGRPLIQADVLPGLPNWLKAVATLQTILGIVLLFLFGLGIRNTFRMK